MKKKRLLLICGLICMFALLITATPSKVSATTKLETPQITSISGVRMDDTSGFIDIIWSPSGGYPSGTMIEIMDITNKVIYRKEASSGSPTYQIWNVAPGQTIQVCLRAINPQYPSQYQDSDLSVAKSATVPLPNDPNHQQEEQMNISSCKLEKRDYKFTYDGTTKTATFDLTLYGAPLIAGTDYTVSNISKVSAGTYTATITGKGYFCGKRTFKYYIYKASPTLYFPKSSITITKGSGWSNKINNPKRLPLNWSSSNTSVIKIEDNRFVTVGTGTTTISAAFAGNSNYKAKTASYQITVNPNTYTVQYNANGGYGAPGMQYKYKGQALALSSVRPAKAGYTFKGWATTASSAAKYQPGSWYNNNRNITLYAVWYKNGPATITPIKLNKIRLPFRNFGAETEKAFCELMFTKAGAKKIYRSRYNNGENGNCYGMAATAGILYKDGKKVSSKGFYKNTGYKWKNGKKWNKSKKVKTGDMVKAMHLTRGAKQTSIYAWEPVSYTIQQLVNTAASDLWKNQATIVTVSYAYSAHSVLAIGYKYQNETWDSLLIYDSYYDNGSMAYLNFKKDPIHGNYTGVWEYRTGAGNDFRGGTMRYWSSLDDSGIDFVTYASYKSVWNNRGKLTYRGW